MTVEAPRVGQWVVWLAVLAACPRASPGVPAGPIGPVVAPPGTATAGCVSGASPAGLRVCAPAELADVLASSYQGAIVIPRDAVWTMTGRDGQPLRNLPVQSGVTLYGERGALASRPLLIAHDLSTLYALFAVTGNDVRIAGLHLRGPKPVASHATREPYVNGIEVVEDFDHQLGRRVVIEDNELELWSGAGVSVTGPDARQVKDPADWPATWAQPVPADVALVHVTHNVLHDNVMDGGGYGVMLGGGAYGTVEANVFDNNRHAIAASGKLYSGYTARLNYVLSGGTEQGDFYNQHFDVHGVGPDGYGGAAGTYFEIASNTVLGDQRYYVVKTRPALMLRGCPDQGLDFHDNVVVHGSLDAAVALTTGGLSGLGIGEDEAAFHFHARANRFGVDASAAIASGDFDGDGQTDVLVANGTGWWFSRAGLRPWEFLQASTRRIDELAFADIDNDGRTDVLSIEGGRLGYASAGTAAWQPLTTLPVAIGELRSGDFDGDGRTDLFYTHGGAWWVWYGATRTWTRTQSSRAAIRELVFGDLDGVRGTDVIAVVGGQWMVSSGATAPWARLNAALTPTLDGAVVADFDGDGRADIAVATPASWRYSAGGRAPLAVLRAGRDLPALSALQIGRFDTSKRVIAVTFGGRRLVAWNGLGASNEFFIRSLQDMR